jgi:hypothetical protein
MDILRSAQGFVAGLGVIPAAAAGTLTATLDRTSLLGALYISSDQPNGEITALTIGGQSLIVSDGVIDINALRPGASGAAFRYIGVPLEQQQAVSLQYQALTGAGFFGACVTTDPVLGEFAVVDVNALGPALNYIGGLSQAGGTNVPAGGNAVATVTIRRNCRIGRMMLTQVGALIGEVTITQIQVNGLNMNSTGAAWPIEILAPNSFAEDGFSLMADVEVNSQLTITYQNAGAAPALVRGAFFCLPQLGGPPMLPQAVVQ